MSGQYIDLNHVIEGKDYYKVLNKNTGSKLYVGFAKIVSGFKEPLKIKFTQHDVTKGAKLYTYYDDNRKPNLFTQAFYGGRRSRKASRKMKRRRTYRR
jgi:hypothetical protein